MKTDLQIQKDILAELTWEPSVNASDIGVEVKGGIVTLAGHVNSYAEKWHAECAAQRVSGVTALTVEINVKLPGTSARSDVDIARSAENVLTWMTSAPKEPLQVKVENGWVTLSGNVEWQFQRTAALDAVRYLMGVRGVSDLIAIKTSVSTSTVKGDIEAALKRRASDDSSQIKVAVNGSEVTLTGAVHGWSERELARHSAWSAAGVRNVIDKMTLAA